MRKHHITTVFRSTVVSNISSLMSSVDSLKEEVQVLKSKLNKEPIAVDDCNTCLLYVRLKHPTKEPLNEMFLASLLETKILAYDIIRVKPSPAFRIKIPKALLHNALTHARVHDCVADIWGGTPSAWGGTPRVLRQTNMEAPEAINSTATTHRSLTISCWNCRGNWNSLSGPLDPGGLRRNSPFGTLAMALQAT